MHNLNIQTSTCNKKLIQLIDKNIESDRVKKILSKNQEILSLKNILIGKKKTKKKKKLSNIKQIEGLIKKAKLDSEGEATLEKIKKEEIKNLGHNLSEMNNDFALHKISELYTKTQLERLGKNFSREELDRIRRKKNREIKEFSARKQAKENYYKMIKLINFIGLVKDKFDKIDNETKNRTIEIDKKIKHKSK